MLYRNYIINNNDNIKNVVFILLLSSLLLLLLIFVKHVRIVFFQVFHSVNVVSLHIFFLFYFLNPSPKSLKSFTYKIFGKYILIYISPFLFPHVQTLSTPAI